MGFKWKKGENGKTKLKTTTSATTCVYRIEFFFALKSSSLLLPI
jgi:hypothetical protein